MSIAPYIHFQGNCAEALRFYAEAFGSAPPEMMTYGQSPDAANPFAGSDRIMHGWIAIGGGMLMASDFPPGMGGDPQKAMSVAWQTDDVPEAKRVHAKLSEGGETIMDLQETFWTEAFAMFKDRFGTHWMISGPSKMPT